MLPSEAFASGLSGLKSPIPVPGEAAGPGSRKGPPKRLEEPWRHRLHRPIMGETGKPKNWLSVGLAFLFQQPFNIMRIFTF